MSEEKSNDQSLIQHLREELNETKRALLDQVVGIARQCTINWAWNSWASLTSTTGYMTLQDLVNELIAKKYVIITIVPTEYTDKQELMRAFIVALAPEGVSILENQNLSS